MKNLLGILGIVVALGGVAVAAFQDELRGPRPPLSEQLKEEVLNRGAELFGGDVEKARGVDAVSATYTFLGFLGLVLGVGSFVRNEDHRISGMAGALGIIAMSWEYVLIGVILAIAVFLLSVFNT